MIEILKSINPEKIEFVAGSANKFVHMVDNKSDFYLNLVPGFKHWDMCGSEAIFQARYGIVSDAKKRPLLYDLDKGHTIKVGIIAAKNKRVFDICQERIEQATGISYEENHEFVTKEAEETKRI